jgi:hypothetical protein
MTDSLIDDSKTPPLADDAISEEKFRSDRPRFRLRLHHFFSLTAVMALLLTIAGPQNYLMGGDIELPAPILVIQSVFGVAYEIPSAVALTALGYGIAAYRRGELFFNQPGHWLLVEISIVALLGLPPAAFLRWMQSGAVGRRTT